MTNEDRRDGESSMPRLVKSERRKRDLQPRPFPVISAEQWRQPDQLLWMLYRDAEQRATDAIDWYLRDKAARRRFSQSLRVLAIALVAAGGLVPLISAAGIRVNAQWGYVLLALAAICVGFDRFFGLSSGWMRDMSTAQALQRRLEVFCLDYTAKYAAAVTRSPGAHDLEGHLALIRRFVEDVSDLVSAETRDWITEFKTNVQQLESQSGSRGFGGQHPAVGLETDAAFRSRGLEVDHREAGSGTDAGTRPR